MEEDCAEAISQSYRLGVILQSKVGKYCQVYFPFTTVIAIWTHSFSCFLHADLVLMRLKQTSTALLTHSWNIGLTPARHQVAVFHL